MILQRKIINASGSLVISNGSILNDGCTSLVGWTVNNFGNGALSQVTYDGRSVFKLDGGSLYNANNQGGLYRGLTPPGSGRLTLSTVVDWASLGDSAAPGGGGQAIIFTYATGRILVCGITADKITLRNSAGSDVTIYTGAKSGWQTLTFDIADVSAGASTICDVFLGAVKIADDASVGWGYSDLYYPLGRMHVYQLARETSPFVQRISYTDKILVGNGLA